MRHVQFCNTIPDVSVCLKAAVNILFHNLMTCGTNCLTVLTCVIINLFTFVEPLFTFEEYSNIYIVEENQHAEKEDSTSTYSSNKLKESENMDME